MARYNLKYTGEKIDELLTKVDTTDIYPYLETTDTTLLIEPNTYYDLGIPSNTTININLKPSTIEGVQEYMFEIQTDAEDITLLMDSDLVWKETDGTTISSGEITLARNKIYQFDIVNNKGLIASFDNPSLASPVVVENNGLLSWSAVPHATSYEPYVNSVGKGEQITLNYNISNDEETHTTLATPTITSVNPINNGIAINFNTVSNATSYIVKCDNEVTPASPFGSGVMLVNGITHGQTHTFQIKASSNQQSSLEYYIEAQGIGYQKSQSTIGTYNYNTYTDSAYSTEYTEVIPYFIVKSLTNLTASGATSIQPNNTATVTLVANTGYILPDII